MGSCCSEFKDIVFLHLWDLKGSGDCENFPLSYYGNPGQHHLDPSLGSAEWYTQSLTASMLTVLCLEALQNKMLREFYAE